MTTHKRIVPVLEHAVLMGTGNDPRSRANHECAGGVSAFCPACEPTIYAAMASRHAAPLDLSKLLVDAGASRSETILSWP